MEEFVNTLNNLWTTYKFILFLICAVAFISFRMPKRKYFAIRVIVSVITLIAISFGLDKLMGVVEGDLYKFFYSLKYFVQFIAVFGAVLVCFDTDAFASAFCATLGYTIQHIVQRMRSVFLKLIDDIYLIFDILITVSI